MFANRAVVLGAVFALALSPLGAAAARAAGTARAAAPAECDLASAIRELRDGLSSEVPVAAAAELELRRRVLGDLLDCVAKTAETKGEGLSRVEAVNDDMRNVKAQLLDRFTRAAEYARSQKSRLPDQGLWGTKDVARTVKVWREDTYLPLEEQTENFRIWQENQLLFGVASRRLDQMSQTLTTLGLIQRGDIRDNILIARRALLEAENANRGAGEAIRHFGESGNTALLIQGSLRALAAAYESFFAVSEAAGKVIPL